MGEINMEDTGNKTYDLELFRFVVEGIALVLVGVLGIIGNICCIFWFSQKVVQKNFHQLMLSLAVCDLLYVLLSIALFGLPNIVNSVSQSNLYMHLVPVFLPLAQIGLTGSIYFTLAITIERYTTVCHPFFKVSHMWTSGMYIVPISLFAILYNSPKFFELTVITQYGNKTEGPVEEKDLSQEEKRVNSSVGSDQFPQQRIAPTSLRLEPIYIKVYLIYSNLFIHGIIPLLGLIYLNCTIYKQIRIIQKISNTSYRRDHIHQREIRLAQVSLGIVAVFITSHSVKWIPNIWELVHADNKVELKWPIWVEYITCLSHLLTTLNSSVNFYIYLFKYFQRKPESPQTRGFSVDLGTSVTDDKSPNRRNGEMPDWTINCQTHFCAEQQNLGHNLTSV